LKKRKLKRDVYRAADWVVDFFRRNMKGKFFIYKIKMSLNWKIS
jgi:hypothetical protein